MRMPDTGLMTHIIFSLKILLGKYPTDFIQPLRGWGPSLSLIPGLHPGLLTFDPFRIAYITLMIERSRNHNVGFFPVAERSRGELKCGIKANRSAGSKRAETRSRGEPKYRIKANRSAESKRTETWNQSEPKRGVETMNRSNISHEVHSTHRENK